MRKADGGIFGCRGRLTCNHRDVIDRCNVHTGHGAGRAAGTVRYGVAELRCAVVVGFGCEIHLLRATCCDQLHRAVRGHTNRGNREDLSIGCRVHIVVIGQQAGSCDCQCDVLGAAHCFTDCHRYVIHRLHREIHGCVGCAALTITHRVAELRRSVVIRIGRELDVTAAQQFYRAVAGARYGGYAQHLTIRCSIGIAVVGEQLRLCEGDSGVFGCRGRLTCHNRNVVDRCNVQARNCIGSSTIAVRHRVAELRCTVVVGFGYEAHLLRATFQCHQLHRAMGCAGDSGNAQHLGVGCLVSIAVVGQQACRSNDERGVFGTSQCLTDGHWYVIHRLHRQVHRCTSRAANAITHLVAKLRRAVVVGLRRELDVTITQQRHRAVAGAGYG